MMVISISAMNTPEVSRLGMNQGYELPRRVLQKKIPTKIIRFERFRPVSEGEELEKTYSDSGLEVSPEELGELKTFREFLVRHIKPSAIRDVQCMLLWAEWVRFYKRQTKKVPDLILEKEFRDLILNKFGCAIAEDQVRGFVYPGVKYIP
jgi:hypothetical protein